MRRLLPIGFAAFALTSLGIFFFGDSGLGAYRGMKQYEYSLAANVEALKQHNLVLEARLQKLRADPESNIVLARDIGMYEPGDSVVKMAGRPPREEIYAVGDLLRWRKADSVLNTRFKEAGLGAALVFLLVAFLAARRNKVDGSRRR